MKPTTQRGRLARYLLLTAVFLSAGNADDVRTLQAAAGAPKIAWFGTWQGGLAEARRTRRPILLVSAAPQCHSVTGIW